MVIFKQKTVRVYHTTKIENVPSIMKHGILRSYHKDRAFERESLGIDMSNNQEIYLSKSLKHLCIPPDHKRVVLQIDLPKEVYDRLERSNKGDPAFQAFKSGNFRNWHDFCIFMVTEMCEQNEKLKEKVNQEIKQYGSLENSPKFKHALSTYDACSPKYCLMSREDINSSWISPEVLTLEDLNKLGIYFGR